MSSRLRKCKRNKPVLRYLQGLPLRAYLHLYSSNVILIHLHYESQIKGRTGQNPSDLVDDEDRRSPPPNNDNLVTEKEDFEVKENGTFVEHVKVKDKIPSDTTVHITQDDFIEEYTFDEGWQAAVPKGRSIGSRKTGSGTRKPNLTKLNTNAFHSENGRYKGRVPSNFSPRVSPNETAAPVASSPLAKKLAKNSSFNSKAVSPAVSSKCGENSSNPNSKPASPAITAATAKVIPSTAPTASQTVRKSLSYKEVAIAAPGTLVKAVRYIQKIRIQLTKVQVLRVLSLQKKAMVTLVERKMEQQKCRKRVILPKYQNQ